MTDDHFANFEPDVKDDIMLWYRRRYNASYFQWLDVLENEAIFKKVCENYWTEYFENYWRV